MPDPIATTRARWGTAKALRSACLQLLNRLTGIQIAYISAREIDGKKTPPALPDGYHIRVLSAAEAGAFSHQPELQLPASFIDQAHSRGDYCVAAFKGDELVSYVWRGYHSTPVQNGITLHFARPVRYGYKALTLPDHRGLRLQQSVVLYSDRKDYEAGYRFAISYVETHNYSSIASEQRRGATMDGYICWGENRLFTTCFTSAGARNRGIFLSCNETSATHHQD